MTERSVSAFIVVGCLFALVGMLTAIVSSTPR
jgi:hypothetical protein